MGVVEKWCSKTNTFVFSFGEATITLEDIMVLGRYPVLSDPVFTSLQDQEMKDIEEKLINARKQLTDRKHGGVANTSYWMDVFIDKGSKIEHEAFLATWLSLFVFPRKNSMVKSCLFPIAIHLARGNSIALGPAVLASIYKDLTLFKKTIIDLSKLSVGSYRYPLEITLESPFYLVQIWVCERLKNLQPQTMLTNHGDPLLFRWHKVQALKIDNVRLALDSAMDDFLWRPYARYAHKYGMFYPNDGIWVLFEKDSDKEMLSLVTCLRVSELVGFESIEQYLPHRVSLQFGMDQDVPSYVPRLNETKDIASENYCRPIHDKRLYFPPRLFEVDVNVRYAKWWKHSVLSCNDFVKKIVCRKRSASWRKQRHCVGIANRSGNDVGVPPGFSFNLVDTLNFGNFSDGCSKAKTRKVDDFQADLPCENFVTDVKVCKPVLKECKCDGKVNESNNLLNECCSTPSADYEKIIPVKGPVSKDNNEFSIGVLEDGFKDANESKKERMCSDRVCLSETQGESRSYGIRNKVSLSNSELGDFISSNVNGEIAGCQDEDEIKNPFCDGNDVNDISGGESVDPFRVYMEFDLENRIEKLDKVFSKLKEARFGQKVETV